MAERPANVLFMAGSIAKEARADGLKKPAMAVGAGLVAGIAAVLMFRRRK